MFVFLIQSLIVIVFILVDTSEKDDAGRTGDNHEEGDGERDENYSEDEFEGDDKGKQTVVNEMPEPKSGMQLSRTFPSAGWDLPSS